MIRHRSVHRLVALVIGVSFLFPHATFAAKGIQGSPKIINLYLNWQLNESDLPALSRWDVVVLDADQQARYPDRVRRLRQLNPSIKILAYLPSEEIANARFFEPPDFPMAKLAARIQDAWYMREGSAQKVFFWPGSAMLNVTDLGPAGFNGVRWNTFLSQFIHDEILSSGLWDGVFLDNTFDGISHFAKTPVDLNRDGVTESAAVADAAWRDGMKKMLAQIAKENPTALVVGNGGAVYANQLNGAMFEHFPSWDWLANWKEFRASIAKNRTPSLTALNVNTDNQDRQNDYRLMRYGLSSALIGGGYYSFDKGDAGHDRLWWYDEYEVAIGQPRSEPRTITTKGAKANSVWSRDFQNGIIIVNSSDATQRIPLPGEFEAIKGAQDPTRNNGAIMTTVDVSSHDGVILLRRTEPARIRGAAFQNGAFVRMYTMQGKQEQNGFFAQRTDVANGATTLVTDVDVDGKEDVVTVTRGVVTVLFGDGHRRSMTPFGSSYRGDLSIAVGNTNRDAAKELIVGRDGNGSPSVAVLNSSGRQLSRWDAYITAFHGGVRAAIGDLDGDRMREIVTGAGPGGGPHIRIWKTDGKVWGGGFFAFDPSETGGVSVAVGDVNGDGKDEIIVGSGQGAIPRVRVFSGRGMLLSELRLGSQPIPSGLRVAATDVNGDGLADILVSGLPVF